MKRERDDLDAVEPGRRVLDDTFGQYQALPLDGSDDVYAYLKSVRSEAESDSAVYYVERSEPKAVEETIQADTTMTDIEYEAKYKLWSQTVLEQFHRLKAEIPQDIEAQGPSEIPESLDSVPKWKKYVMDNKPPPIATFFRQFDRPMVFKLVVYFTRWLSVSANANLSQWIWSALLRIDNLLDPNEASVIRDLGKKAVKLSSRTESENTTQVARYTIDSIIVIVGTYFGQRDLLGSRAK